jgi:hypothetical protein
MLSTRRQTIDACRAGPTLFAGLPGNEVDLDRLAGYLVTRGFDGGIHAADATLEGVLWIHDGAPGETWFLEAGGTETIFPIEPERELLRDIAASGAVTVFIGRPPTGDVVGRKPSGAPGVAPDDAAPIAAGAASEPPVRQAAGPIASAPPPPLGPPAARAVEPPARPVAAVPDVAAPAPGEHTAIPGEPTAVSGPMIAPWEVPSYGHRTHGDPPTHTVDAPTHPWPAILTEIASRVARHRGQRLAARFLDALAHTLAADGGEVHGERITAPPLPESTWRVIVEAACAPVIAVAGRAFIDRTITAAERAALAREREDGES